jgi:hypothetical protein
MKVKVRYLAQGIIEIPAKDLPENLENMTKDEAWEWLLEWWENNVTQEMLNKGIEDCDSGPSEVNPGLLEKCPEDGDYETIAMTQEFDGWWFGNSALQPPDHL